MIGDSGVNEMKDTKLTLYPSVLDDHSRSFVHLQDQKRSNAKNSFGGDHRDKAHQEDGVGGEESDIDSLVAQDLNSLSMAERERILHDLHGVAETTTENPPQIARCLHTLDHELDRITNRSTSVAPAVDNGRPETSSDGDHATSLAAYNMAKQLSPEYVSNRSFRLMFLRADQFDGEQAAIRIANFFRAKLDLFGPTKLVKDITLDDLNEDDKAILNSGVLQASDEKDQAGRPLLCDFINYRRRSRGKSAHGSSKVSMVRWNGNTSITAGADSYNDVNHAHRGALPRPCLCKHVPDAVVASAPFFVTLYSHIYRLSFLPSFLFFIL